jgi:hypothetical protein
VRHDLQVRASLGFTLIYGKIVEVLENMRKDEEPTAERTSSLPSPIATCHGAPYFLSIKTFNCLLASYHKQHEQQDEVNKVRSHHQNYIFMKEPIKTS